ncbi:recombinase family protein [uncultured Limosilactobacillus sp.]|uniref:recombinase family protein n=1 Tax=uncultured Limosilactobacillus sp. TaxID=2837629 RepID=UPI0025D9D8CD|nr:recombinase family protein [uncultured Limosilactobacillus sp.]
MTQYGYARVSTKGQELADQINQLQNAGISENCIYSEKFTGTTTDRPQFAKLTQLVKPGDVITVTKLDRLARNTREALNVIDPLMNQGVKINVLNIGMLENSTVGKLVKTILLAVAEMERDMIVDRTQEGKRYAKLHRSDYHEGRPKRAITPHYQAAYEYLLTHSYKQTARAFDISISTLQRIRKQVEQNNIA